jgi:hypothetical protein
VLDVFVPLHIPVDKLSVTDVGATFIPLIAASILVYREEEMGGVKRLLARILDDKRIRRTIW